MRGLLYFLAILSAALIIGRLPLLRVALGQLPWYLRDLVLPGASAVLLTMIRIDGRPFHLAALALLRHWADTRRMGGTQPGGPGRRCRRGRPSGILPNFVPGERWHPGEIVILPDGSDAKLRRLRYTGPGAVLVAVEHSRRGRAIERRGTGLGRGGRRPALTLRELAGRRALSQGQVIALAPGARLLVRPDAARSCASADCFGSGSSNAERAQSGET